MDLSSELALQVALVVLVPGFLSWTSFRFMASFKGAVGDFASVCYALIFGFGLLVFWNSIEGNSGAIHVFLSDPLTACFVFSLIGVLCGWVLGWIVGKFTSILR